jgi:L-seryl-tRNA(Ser) seleniumtransferase
VTAEAERIRSTLQNLAARKIRAEVVPCFSQVGGGSLPGEEIPSAALDVECDELAPGEFARSLRVGIPAVFGRISHNRLLLDVRTVHPNEEEPLARAIASAAINDERL